MSFAAKSAIPNDAGAALRQPVLEQAAEGGMTLFTAPAGYLFTDGLAANLAEHGRPALWLRLGTEDCDPAMFLLSFIAGAQRINPGIGTATLMQMQRQVGPIVGWPALFEYLGQELAAALPASGVIVLEHVHRLNDTHPTLGLFATYLLPALPESVALILTAEHLPRVALPAGTVHRTINDLRVDNLTALWLAKRFNTDLPTRCIHRMVALTDGRAVALAGLFASSAVLGPALVQQAVDRATSLDDLLGRIAHAWLATASSDALQALAVAMRLEYSHPALLMAALGTSATTHGPWLQPLADGWLRVRQVWRAPLRKALRAGAVPSSDALRRVADYLTDQAATEQAVPLYFELGDTGNAAQAIAGAAERLMSFGQWETLSTWLGQLPTPTLYAWPWLVYTGGEIAAAQGHTDIARRALAVASTLFTARHDTVGACQSLLAESSLAAWHGDRAFAQSRALAANAMAEGSGLDWYQGWSAWQLGCLAAAAGELDNALVYFDRAATSATSAGDSSMVELLRQLEALAIQERDLQRQREHYRQAYFAAEHAEHEVDRRLRLLLNPPPDGIGAMLDAHGWLRTPLMLKLPAPEPPVETHESLDHASLWDRVLAAIGLRRRPAQPVHESPLNETRPPVDVSPLAVKSNIDHAPLFTAPASIDKLSLTAPATTESAPALPALETTAAPPGSGKTDRVAPPKAAIEPSKQPTLTVHLLGTFRVAVNDLSVKNWPTGKGRAVFKYLLTHRDQPTPRDVLMDVFWPNASPGAARNSLNVALHSLRKVLRIAIDVPIIVFQDGAYHLNPDLRLWIDVDEFDRHVQAGRRLEAVGQIAPTTAEYELAVGLYQGDFLADDLYEEWPVLARERLRVAYLDMLDRLNQIYFSQGKYASCITLCQLILNRDNCREDAHCLLMRCYSHQGQHHLALRQYQICVEALREELEVDPAPETTQLYERIRRRERV